MSSKLDEEAQEKIARGMFQLVYLVSDKEIEQYWKRLQPSVKSQWGDKAESLIEIIEELGYRKPPDRPELEKEITNTLKRVYIRANGSLPNATQMQLIWNDVDYILALIPDRLPKDKPLLLSDDEINKAFDEAFDKPISFDHKPTPEEIITIRLRAVAQAQWNICVYHSEGGNRA